MQQMMPQQSGAAEIVAALFMASLCVSPVGDVKRRSRPARDWAAGREAHLVGPRPTTRKLGGLWPGLTIYQAGPPFAAVPRLHDGGRDGAQGRDCCRAGEMERPDALPEVRGA